MTLSVFETDVHQAIGEVREILKQRYEQRLGIKRVAWLLLPEAINTLMRRPHHSEMCVCHSWPEFGCPILWKICHQFNITSLPTTDNNENTKDKIFWKLANAGMIYGKFSSPKPNQTKPNQTQIRRIPMSDNQKPLLPNPPYVVYSEINNNGETLTIATHQIHCVHLAEIKDEGGNEHTVILAYRDETHEEYLGIALNEDMLASLGNKITGHLLKQFNKRLMNASSANTPSDTPSDMSGLD